MKKLPLLLLALAVTVVTVTAMMPAPGGTVQAGGWCRHHRHCPSPSPGPSVSSTAPAPSPSVTVSSTAPAPPPSSPASSPPPAGACVTAAADGFCPGPGQNYDYPGVTLSAGHSIYLANNMWNAGALPSATQVLTAVSPGDWSVTATLAAGNTAVITAPQVRVDLAGAPVPLSSFGHLTSTFAVDMGEHAGTGAQAGYDVWSGTSGAGLFAQEMMIWTDTVNRGVCGGATPVASGVVFGGSNGVPPQSWNLCRNGPPGAGSEMIWYLPSNEKSGSVDILGMISWLVSAGYYPPGTGISQVDETFEICSTGGSPEVFTTSGFTLDGG